VGGGKAAGSAPGEKCTGECLIYIEFIDTRERHGPKDFKHESHVGWTKEGGFDINNIPAEWKKIFKQVGIRRADLENNPELAGQVLDIMQKAEAETSGGLSAAPAPPPHPQQSYHQQPQQVYSQPTPQVSAPPPPPAPGGGGGGGGGGTQRSYAPQAPAAPSPPPPAPEPVPVATVSSSGGMSDLEKQLQARAGNLRSVGPPSEIKGQAPATEGNALAGALMAALKQHRKDIEGDDGDDGWGEEDGASDDWQ